MKRTVTTVAANKLPAGVLGTLLEAFWEHRKPPQGMLMPAYRATVSFLLGVGLRQQYALSAEDLEALCPITGGAHTVEAQFLDRWCFRATACLGKAGYHAFEGIYGAFCELYGWLEGDDKARTVGQHTYTCYEWAATAVLLPFKFPAPERFFALRADCLQECRRRSDFLSYGLGNLDIWWRGGQAQGLVDGRDVMATVLASSYTDTPVERAIFHFFFSAQAAEGLARPWEAFRVEGVLGIYEHGLSFRKKIPAMHRALIEEAAADAGRPVVALLGGLFERFRIEFESVDPKKWCDDVVPVTMKVLGHTPFPPYLPTHCRIQSAYRVVMDYAFWAGIVMDAHLQGEI